MDKEFFKLDSLLVEGELCLEKAKNIIGTLDQEYFSLSNEKMITFYYEDAGIKCNIVQDYINLMDDILRKMNDIVQSEFQRSKECSN